MACLNVESFAYPAWWAEASVVQVQAVQNDNDLETLFTGSKDDVEFLPQGISFNGTLLVWNRVYRVLLVS